MVEDANRELRHREQLETNNRLLAQVKQWGALRAKEVLAQHRRQEVQAPTEAPGLADPPLVKKPLVTATGHIMSLDGWHITDNRGWPSFTPHRAQSLAAQLALLRHGQSKDCWAEAGRCACSMLLPPRMGG